MFHSVPKTLRYDNTYIFAVFYGSVDRWTGCSRVSLQCRTCREVSSTAVLQHQAQHKHPGYTL